jgi:hypothetical protein
MTRNIPLLRRAKAPFWIALGLFSAILFVYVQTLAPGLAKGDGGELQHTLAVLGVAHPTGYPLYTLVGWLWAKFIPFGTIAWRVNLFSAVCGAAAAVMVYGIVYRLTRRVLPGLAGACFLAFSPSFWILSSTTEVYALHALFVAAIFYLLLVWRDAGTRRFKVLIPVTFVYGLSLSHHRTMLLLAPAILLFVLLEQPVLWQRRQGGGRKVRTEKGQVHRWLVLILVFLAGLLPYLHLFIHQLKRGRTMYHVIFRVILGVDFSGFLGFRSDPLRILWELPRQQVGTLGLIAAAIGLGWLIWKQRSVAWLLGGSYVATMLFCLFYRIEDIQDFMIPATLCLAIWAGASAGFLLSGSEGLTDSPSHWFQGRRRWAQLALEGVLLLAALLSLRQIQTVRAALADTPGSVEEKARALLNHPFEPNETVVTDLKLFGTARYLRVVEEMNVDFQVMPAKLLQEKNCNRLLQAMESGGSVYVATDVQITRLPDGYRFAAEPPFLRVTKDSPPYTRLNRQLHPQLTLEGIWRQDRLLVLRWLVTGSPLPKDYTIYVHFFDADGQPIGQWDKGAGAEASCWYPPTAWPVGQVTQDLFFIPSETTSVRVGLYAWHEGQIDPVGTATMLSLP